jgi:hypothetical protein
LPIAFNEDFFLSKLFSVYVKLFHYFSCFERKMASKNLLHAVLSSTILQTWGKWFQKKWWDGSPIFLPCSRTHLQGYLQFGLGRGGAGIYNCNGTTLNFRTHGPKVCVCNYRFLACGCKVSLVRNLSSSGFRLHVF